MEKISDEIKAKVLAGYNEFFPFKPILTPLEDITDEDAIEVAKMIGTSDIVNFDKSQFVYVMLQAFEKKTVNFNIYQFLQSKGYDLPNYLLDGKTLIESGLAIKTA